MFDKKVKRIFLCRNEDWGYTVLFLRKDGVPIKDEKGVWLRPAGLVARDWERIDADGWFDMDEHVLHPGEMVELTLRAEE